MTVFHVKQGFVITEDYEGEEQQDEKIITFIPLSSWLSPAVKEYR